jgi:hypothetical protein
MAILTGQVTATTSAAAIGTSSPNPFTLILHNESATNDIFLGGSGVTSTTGFSLHSNSTISLPMTAGDQLYAITGTGSHLISWMKIY